MLIRYVDDIFCVTFNQTVFENIFAFFPAYQKGFGITGATTTTTKNHFRNRPTTRKLPLIKKKLHKKVFCLNILLSL